MYSSNSSARISLSPRWHFGSRRAWLFAIIFAILGVALLLFSFADTGFGPSSGRPFSSASPWNSPIGTNAQLDPNNVAMVANLTSGTNPVAADVYEFGTAIYSADASTPTYHVHCTEPWGTCNIENLQVPIPNGAKGSPGSDSAMTVIDFSAGKAYCLWQYKNDNATTSWGDVGSINSDGTGATCTGAGMLMPAGLIRTFEVHQGYIDHALVFSTGFCAGPNNGNGSTNYRFPATKSDGTYTGTGAVPEGTRIQLDPSINVDAISNITPIEKMIAKALQKYGAYAMDCGGSHMGFGFQLDPTATSATSIGSTYMNAGLRWDYDSMPHIPWTNIRVLQAWNSYDNPPPSPTSVPPPTTPTNVTAKANSPTTVTIVALNWTASTDTGGSGLAGYYILRGGTKIGQVASPTTTYTDNTAAPNTTYSYTIEAFDVASPPNVSSPSPAASVTTSPQISSDSTSPTQPTNPTATAISSAKINLSWSASTDNVGVTGYNIYRNGSSSPIASVTTTSFGDSGLKASTAYSYYIVATDAAGNRSTPSTTVKATTQAAATITDTTPPSAPTTFRSTSIQANSVSVAWNPSIDNVGVAGYRFWRGDGSWSNWVNVGAVPASTLSFTNTGLTSNQSYSYCARAYDAAGNTSASSSCIMVKTTSSTTSTQAISALTVPTGLRGTATSSQVSLSWSASTDTGGPGLASYRLYRNGSSTALATTNAPTTTYNDASLAASTTYSYQVSAVDSAGKESAKSSLFSITTQAAATITDTTPPSAPTTFRSTSIQANSVSVAWNPSSDNVGVTHYVVWRGDSNWSNWVSVGDVQSPTASFTNTGLQAGTSYSYAVRALDATGNISASSNTIMVKTGSAATADTTPPSVPTNVKATAVSTSQVNVTWNPSTDNVAVKDYNVLRNGVQIATVTTGTSFGDATVAANTTYSFTVVAIDTSSNTSAASTPATVTIPLATAPPPTATGPCGTATSTPPATYDHVIWIWYENHAASEIRNNANAPYANQLANQCGYASNYSGITHPSLPNYLAATGGSNNGITNDCTANTCSVGASSIYQQVSSAGKQWRHYSESMTTNCQQTDGTLFMTKHTPANYYTAIRSNCNNWSVPMGSTASGPFLSDLNNNTLPAFSFITPNMCNDTHDCSIPVGDAWLQSWMPKILDSSSFKSGKTVIFITYDEGNSTDNHVFTSVLNPYVHVGTTSSTAFNHYSLLRTTEEMLGINQYLGGAAGAPSMKAAFGL